MEGMNEKEGMGGMRLGRKERLGRKRLSEVYHRRMWYLRSRVNKVFQEAE